MQKEEEKEGKNEIGTSIIQIEEMSWKSFRFTQRKQAIQRYHQLC